MAHFFIGRPIFAWVIAILIMMVGGLSIARLPVSQYPEIAPPSVMIMAIYPGASTKTVEDAVTQVIEQKMTGLDNLRYMSSASDASGTVTITLTFEAGTNSDVAQMQVQNKLALATPLLPQEVQRMGVRVQKASSNFALVVVFTSSDPGMVGNDVANYVASTVVDPISRVSGVGDYQLFGTQYAMRIWLDPKKLSSHQLTPADVTYALQAQNALVSSGSIGAAPALDGQQISATIIAQSRFENADQFRGVLLRVNPDGSQVRLGDVARVELAGENLDIESFFSGKPATGVAIKLAPGANALDTVKAVRARLTELSAQFPHGMQMHYTIDSTTFVRLSIHEVVKTLLEAIVLVFFVMLLFLQNFRATLIPTIAVPVVLLGTFGVLAAFGFSINTLTLFGMVLAIGLLVDDAIVVVENVERIMAEEGLSPVEATRKSMGQITGALVGIATVLSAVFIPMAFFGGSAGVIYRQFSITLVSAMVLSVIVALTLTPALCATLLKPATKAHEAKRASHWFNRLLARFTNRYEQAVGSFIHRWRSVVLAFVAIVAALAFLYGRMPTGFLPGEDQGQLLVQANLPPGATIERTRAVTKEITDYFLTQEKDAVSGILAVNGFNFAGRTEASAMAFVSLKDWSLRGDSRLRADAVAGRATAALQRIKEAQIFAFTPPPIIELGTANGIDVQLVDRVGLGHEKLMAARNQLMGMLQQESAVTKVRPNGQDDTAQYKIDIDWQKASTLGVSFAEVNSSLSSTWGQSYVNDFIDNGRVKKVFMQADSPFRMTPQDVNQWFVRNMSGTMTPFSAFATGRWIYGSPRLERFNGVPSMELLGEPALGFTSGDAMKVVEANVSKLPQGVGVEWSGISFDERMSGSGAAMLYLISLAVVFLALAALYESWSVPFVVLLVVPLGVIGAVVASTARGLSNDIYFQVGLLTTIGLSAKNAILIVEFAKARYQSGQGLVEATIEAARLRLRPILMTSVAFIMGVLPLALSHGVGAGGQNAIGWSVVGGMTSATVLAILFIPVFFVVVTRLTGKRQEVAVAAPLGEIAPEPAE